ncbi:MAG: hypothetical protein WCN95_03810 [bacterium]
MTESMFKIGAQGVDTRAIVNEIRASVGRKAEQGLYSDPRIARAEKTNLSNLSDQEFDQYYMECLRDAVFVDINDFEIHERRRLFSGLLVGFKRLIWKMLRFYTYRLWSQQNEVNAILLAATEANDNRYRDKIEELEARIARLEGTK